MEQTIKTQVGDVEVLLPVLSAIPSAIQHLPFAVWQAEPELDRDGNQKLKANGKPRISKAPKNAQGYNISKSKPAQWMSYQDAMTACSTGRFSGVGVLLQHTSGIVGIDLDDVQDLFRARPALRQLMSNAKTAGIYCEHSPSGNGLRMFVYGVLPGHKGKRQGGIELYSDASFLTVTGRHGFPGAVVPAQWLVDDLLAMIAAPGATPQPIPLHTVAASAIPQVAKPNPKLVATLSTWAANEHPRLWTEGWDAPPQFALDKKYSSQSEADMALAGHIARQAVVLRAAPNQLEATVMSVFEQSRLYRPEKRRAMSDHTIPKVAAAALEEAGLIRPLIDEVNERFGLIEGIGIYDKKNGRFMSDQQFRQLYSNRHVEIGAGAP